jgi:hypothetical protein
MRHDLEVQLPPAQRPLAPCIRQAQHERPAQSSENHAQRFSRNCNLNYSEQGKFSGDRELEAQIDVCFFLKSGHHRTSLVRPPCANNGSSSFTRSSEVFPHELSWVAAGRATTSKALARPSHTAVPSHCSGSLATLPPGRLRPHFGFDRYAVAFCLADRIVVAHLPRMRRRRKPYPDDDQDNELLQDSLLRPFSQ